MLSAGPGAVIVLSCHTLVTQNPEKGGRRGLKATVHFPSARHVVDINSPQAQEPYKQALMYGTGEGLREFSNLLKVTQLIRH